MPSMASSITRARCSDTRISTSPTAPLSRKASGSTRRRPSPLSRSGSPSTSSEIVRVASTRGGVPRVQTPFQMAVLGDSVVWGSGLPEEDKAWMLVRLWLEERMGRPVQVQVLAHSLAVIEPDPTRDTRPPAWGEIRFRNPSITYEALADPRLSNPGPRAIDLVLIDGGINDMNP